jgi:hypothetical protein
LTIQQSFWEIIKYYEKKYFLLFKGENDDLTGVNFKEMKTLYLDGISDEKEKEIEINSTFYKPLCYFVGNIGLNRYEIYKRTKISFLDVIANICALSTTILNFFIIFLSKFYSKNFDNYKIIEQVLSKERKIKKFINKDISADIENDKKNQIELTDNSGKSDFLLNDENDKKINEDFEEIKKNNNYKDYNNEDEQRILPKLKFIDFIFNFFYNSKLCSSKKQKIITSCNEIVSKYSTIEYLVYNQMKIENLLKDYKWNEPKLKNIDNNDLIIQLESYYKT